MSRRFHRPGAGSGTRAGPCRRNRTRSQRIRAMVQNEEKPAMNRCTHRSGHRKAAETSRRRKRRWKRINIGLTTTQDAMAEERKRFTNTRRVTRTISIGNSLVTRYSREYLPSRKTGRAIHQTKGNLWNKYRRDIRKYLQIGSNRTNRSLRAQGVDKGEDCSFVEIKSTKDSFVIPESAFLSCYSYSSPLLSFFKFDFLLVSTYRL